MLAGAAELNEVKSSDLQLIRCVRKDLVDGPQISRVNFCHSPKNGESLEILSSQGFGLPVDIVHNERVAKMAQDASTESLSAQSQNWDLNFKQNDQNAQELELTLTPLKKNAELSPSAKDSLDFTCSAKAVDRCSI